MPRPTLKIVASQRDALYQQVRNHLGALNDIWIAMECNRDFATAEQLAIEFTEDFRLMRDLGWDQEDPRDTVDLTMPEYGLVEVARRLREEAQGGLANSENERESSGEAKTLAAYELARDTCDEILDVLGVIREGRPRVRRV